ncbi:MAG TPA: tRNA (adenosine(37)-N6)-dimethylallyltransferase MiaA [Thermodesulfobacteriota bacterium]|nr:tRNA (adenosine(37)-N6)-dimethylallyltransferase MiaA [Thermodesulfobacteriota bacterium]
MEVLISKNSVIKDKPKLLVILGPTAVGKSKVGIEIAKRIGGEIVNADSLQVYRYLDIGTAKPLKEEHKQVPHHLIDIIDPNKEFNAGLYRKTAVEVIRDLHKRSAKKILVGGTYLYVRVLLYGIIEGISADMEIRDRLRKLKSTFGISYIYEKLKSFDSESAIRIHPNDYVRIERALEAYYLTGSRMSELQEKHGFKENEYEVLKIGLLEEREILRKRIDERVDRMLEEGLVDEVKKLLEMGFGKDLKPMQSIGYKQINQYLDGEITVDRAIELIKRDTKRFAKRQMTWLRKDKDIHWYHLPEDLEKIINEAEIFLN